MEKFLIKKVIRKFKKKNTYSIKKLYSIFDKSKFINKKLSSKYKSKFSKLK
ncbi:hypothetical protein [Candidatus Carsonella ruddii]|uniref:Uncharacterized protein n=1 Tax=Candidatus Carsonella ruddii (Diaphorina cf. continua) TaxID=2661587 RepID=A0A7R7ACH3_CARRU|nr:hypothetical protein [Candidatus Carsonella ruddii (Diaphorina cf. continua)]BCG49369.1 hypothetical protein CRDco_1440 [Candidatus Carsonella ruddii (Diaphorina cf. continua)]